MPLYRVTSQDFEPLPETSFEAERLYERGDIQRRLRDRPEILEDGLFIIAEEYGDWEESNRRIDLLALDKEGRLTVIELKRSDWDSLMDLQAIRYAAMVANMTREQAIDAHKTYLRNRGQDEGESERLVARLAGDDADLGIDSSNPRITLVSASFSKGLTTSVLWLNERDMDIACVKLQLYGAGDSLFLESSRIIPIPEVEDYQVRLRNREEEFQQQQQEASRVETSPGSNQFRRSIATADESMKSRLGALLDLAVSLEREELAALSANSGSYNTVLRVRLLRSDRGFFNVFKNESGWGYLKFGSARLFDSHAPRTKVRLEQILNGTITPSSTVWELPDGFLDALADAYREANGYPVSNAGQEHGSESETTVGADEPEQPQE